MKVTFNYSVKQILIFLWIIFSLLYILFDLYKDAVVGMYNKGYLVGKEETLSVVATNVSNEKCETITIQTPKGGVEVINVACLQQQAQTSLPQATQEFGTQTEEGSIE